MGFEPAAHFLILHVFIRCSERLDRNLSRQRHVGAPSAYYDRQRIGTWAGQAVAPQVASLRSNLLIAFPGQAGQFGVSVGTAALRFAEMTGVRPMIEKYPLAEAADGYARMMSGKAEFRVVLTM